MFKSDDLKKLILEILDDNKIVEIETFDLSRFSYIADTAIICTATSSRHAKSSAEHMMKTLKDHNIQPIGIEGGDVAEWMLIDLGDIVIHIMLAETRIFYDLEGLYSIQNEEQTSQVVSEN
jgi:ribosome-associated protein